MKEEKTRAWSPFDTPVDARHFDPAQRQLATEKQTKKPKEKLSSPFVFFVPLWLDSLLNLTGLFLQYFFIKTQ